MGGEKKAPRANAGSETATTGVWYAVEVMSLLVEEGDGNWDQNGHLKLGDLAAELDGNSVGGREPVASEDLHVRIRS